MPIDASIYSQFAPKVQSPLDVQNALSQAGQNQLAMQHARMQLQQMQTDQADQNALREAYRGGADPSTPEGRQALMKAAPLQAGKIIQAGAEYNKTLAETNKFNAQGDKAKTETDAQKLELASREWAGLDPHDDHAFAGVLAKQVKLGNITPEDATAYGDKLTKMTPDERQREYYQQGLKGLDMKAQAELRQKQAEEAGRNMRNEADLTNRVLTTKMNNDTSRSNVATTQAGENARHGETIQNSRVLAGLNPDGSQKLVVGPDGNVDLKSVAPEDLAAAYRYKTDGTFPPNMGRGVQGAAEGRKIRAIASALDAQAGDSPEDARIRQLAAKGDIGAINQMRKREVAVGANVKNFDFNADQVLQLSGKVDRTGVPIANAWINAGRRAVTGNPELSAFDTAIKTTVNEFAQIVSGTTAGATTEGEKKKAETLLNAQQTPEQLVATINQMRIESQNRMKSFKAQRAESMPTNAPRAAEPAKVVHFGDLK